MTPPDSVGKVVAAPLHVELEIEAKLGHAGRTSERLLRMAAEAEAMHNELTRLQALDRQRQAGGEDAEDARHMYRSYVAAQERAETAEAALREAQANDRRYRWLRKNIWWSPAGSGEVRWVTYLHMLEPPTSDAEMSEDSTAQSLDAAIDAAIGGTGDA